MEYKIIVAPTIDRLELLVNEFLKTDYSDEWAFNGPPAKFGHEEYVQALIKY